MCIDRLAREGPCGRAEFGIQKNRADMRVLTSTPQDATARAGLLDLRIAYQRRIWGARNLHLVFLNARLENVSTKRVHCIRFYRLDTIDAAVFTGDRGNEHTLRFWLSA